MAVDSAALASRLGEVRERISSAATRADRTDLPELIVVTKFHPPQLVDALADLGVRAIGENRHPEARDKFDVARRRGLETHFIGQLQSNKAKLVAAYADVVQTIDRDRLIAPLASAFADALPERSLSVFVQLALRDDAGRGGIDVDDLLALAASIAATPSLDLRGVMAVAPLGVEPRRAFATVREASVRMRTVTPGASAISMGMSGDFEDAILEGATHLRIGTAITGNRPEAT